VLKDGRVVLDWIAPGVRDDEQHLLFSVTKAVTGTLACALASRGLLDLDAAAADVVPELAPSALGSATVRQLMDMEASFAYVEDYSPGEDLRAYREACGWYPAPPDARSLREYLVHRTPDGPHGERFRYLSPTTEALAWVCARAAGTTWAEAVERLLWLPAGTELGGYVTLDREGTPRAAGGLCALPRDVARFGLLMAERSDVLSPELWDDVLRGGSVERFAAGDFAELFPGGSYRAGWYTPNLDPDVALGIGIHGQMLYVDVPRQVVVVVLSSFTDPDRDEWHLDNHALCRTLAHALA
jgi:CubicO group peptidase (beta-lactamase class C family)